MNSFKRLYSLNTRLWTCVQAELMSKEQVLKAVEKAMPEVEEKDEKVMKDLKRFG